MSNHDRVHPRRGRGAILALLLGATISVPLIASAQTSKKPQRVEIEGSVEQLAAECPKGSFVIGTQTVTIDARTRFDDGVCADLADGRKVEVEGTVRNGRIVARLVDLDD